MDYGNLPRQARDKREENSTKKSFFQAVAAVNPNVVVVVASPGPMVLPWHSRVKSILANFLPGQQVGPAVADILFGTVNPAGKLPVTFPESYNVTADPESFPGLGLNGTSNLDPNGAAFVPWMYPSFANYTEKQVRSRLTQTFLCTYLVENVPVSWTCRDELVLDRKRRRLRRE